MTVIAPKPPAFTTAVTDTAATSIKAEPTHQPEGSAGPVDFRDRDRFGGGPEISAASHHVLTQPDPHAFRGPLGVQLAAPKTFGPSMFLRDSKSQIGTPRGITANDRTFDVPFHDFAQNKELQQLLKLGSAIFSAKGPELTSSVAYFLSDFGGKNSDRNFDYMANNGMIRILATDDTLFESLKKMLPQD